MNESFYTHESFFFTFQGGQYQYFEIDIKENIWTQIKLCVYVFLYLINSNNL